MFRFCSMTPVLPLAEPTGNSGKRASNWASVVVAPFRFVPGNRPAKGFATDPVIELSYGHRQMHRMVSDIRHLQQKIRRECVLDTECPAERIGVLHFRVEERN